MRLTPTEERIYRVLCACRAYGTEMTTPDLLERLGLRDRHILKTHTNNMRRKGVPVHGHRGGSNKFGRAGGYALCRDGEM